MLLDTFVEIYKITNIETYHTKILDLLDFIQNFITGTAPNIGYAAQVNWNGTSITNNTIILDWNLKLMLDKLKLFLITNNGTLYLQANNIYNFLNDYFWDSAINLYNYSIIFGGTNNTNKYTESNAIAIRALLAFKINDFYLTRANTTISLLFNHLWTNNAFNFQTANDWTKYFLHGLISVKNIKITAHNAKAIIELIKLSNQLNVPNYLSYAELITKFLLQYSRYNGGFVYNVSENGDRGENIIYDCESNARMIIALIDLYDQTNNITYLEIANDTWYFLDSTFWDNKNGGYNYSIGGGGYNRLYKSLTANSWAIMAGLKILKSNYAIFNPIRNNISSRINETINVINNRMWDNVNYGYYSNASTSWSPYTNLSSSKQLISNSLMIQILAQYNQIYPSHPNFSNYWALCINTTNFLLTNFIDHQYGGAYKESYENGTQVDYGKNIISMGEFLEALYYMYQKYNAINYLKNLTFLINYINLYFWDFEYGGYYLEVKRKGAPKEFLSLGTYGTAYTKYLVGNLYGIDSLLLMDEINENNTNYLIIVENNSKHFDFNERYIPINITLYDSECTQINVSEIYVLITGSESTTSDGKNLYGMAEKYIANYNAGKYMSTINISAFLGKFIVSIYTFNLSLQNYAFYYIFNRSLSYYLSIAYRNINTLPNQLIPVVNLWDYSNYGYFTKILDDNKTTFNNLIAIRTILDFIRTTGLNYGLNWTTGKYENMILNYVKGVLKYLENVTITNETLNYISYISSTSDDDTKRSNVCYCRDNALAVITFLELYDFYNQSNYLETANKTWNYINNTFWDNNSSGFFTNNQSSSSSNK
ncbi:MAG: hypothetical protein ACTSPQ_21360, partial [Candidatus Helarchaeota archaeon]